MNKQRIFIVSAIAVYLVLIAVFFHYENSNFERFYRRNDGTNCTYKSPCVSVCPNDLNYSDDELKQKIQEFVNSREEKNDLEKKQNFSIFMNDLKCNRFDVKVIKNDFEISKVPYVGDDICKHKTFAINQLFLGILHRI